MRIKVDFTIEVAREDLDKLVALAAAGNLEEARDFFKCDAEDYLIGYLSDHGIRSAVIRRA